MGIITQVDIKRRVFNKTWTAEYLFQRRVQTFLSWVAQEGTDLRKGGMWDMGIYVLPEHSGLNYQKGEHMHIQALK